MTKEEAINRLVDIKEYYTEDRDFSYYGDEYHGLTVKEKEALCLAISILNHSATDINVATEYGDIIYRQDAIDALDCINGTEEVLRSLPPAQPTEASCWGCNCTKMERLKEQKPFSEMVHLHDTERRKDG